MTEDTQTLAGRTAFVTGGLRSISVAIARKFAAQGASVAITYNASPDRAAEVVAAIVGLGMAISRYGQPGEIASVVAYLAGPEAALITRAEIVANGGMTA